MFESAVQSGGQLSDEARADSGELREGGGMEVLLSGEERLVGDEGPLSLAALSIDRGQVGGGGSKRHDTVVMQAGSGGRKAQGGLNRAAVIRSSVRVSGDSFHVLWSSDSE